MNVIAEEIKQRIPISTILNSAGLVPNKSGFIHSIFKPENNPSCKIYHKENRFYDYSIGKGGSVIDLYMELYKVDISTAIKELKQIGGLSDETNEAINRGKLKVIKKKKSEAEILEDLSEDEKHQYYKVLELSGGNKIDAVKSVRLQRLRDNVLIFDELYSYCSKNWNAAAKKYLQNKRKLDWKYIQKFKIFSIDNYFQVNNHMKKTFSVEALQRSGLFNENGNMIFYNHKIIIPYLQLGKPVYLRGRYFDGKGSSEGINKYLGLKNDSLKVNTPKRFFNSDVFNVALPGSRIFITEGEFDAISLSSLDYYSIAIPGVGNIPRYERFNKLKGFVPVVCVDNDSAGEKLQEELKDIFGKMDKEFLIKKLPFKDANELLIKS